MVRGAGGAAAALGHPPGVGSRIRDAAPPEARLVVEARCHWRGVEDQHVDAWMRGREGVRLAWGARGRARDVSWPSGGHAAAEHVQLCPCYCALGSVPLPLQGAHRRAALPPPGWLQRRTGRTWSRRRARCKIVRWANGMASACALTAASAAAAAAASMRGTAAASAPAGAEGVWDDCCSTQCKVYTSSVALPSSGRTPLDVGADLKGLGMAAAADEV